MDFLFPNILVVVVTAVVELGRLLIYGMKLPGNGWLALSTSIDILTLKFL
jgi:hypothetical protein